MKKINLLDIRDKKIEISSDLVDYLIEQLNSKLIDEEEMFEVFKDSINEHDMICSECYGQAENTRAEVHVCQSCRTVEGKLLEAYEFDMLGIVQIGGNWMRVPENFCDNSGF